MIGRFCLLALLAFSSVAIADDFKVSNLGMSGSELKETCDRSDAECFSYIVAAIDGFEVAFTVFLDVQKRKNVTLVLTPYCLPEGITRQKVYETARKYLYDHPDRREFDAASSIVAGLSQSFPCAKAGAQ
jgi:hypothetical protein